MNLTHSTQIFLQLGTTRHSPIIVGERYELAETLALKYSGEHNESLPNKPDYQTGLLSMSGYDGKDGATPLNDSNAGRSGYAWAGNTQYGASHASQSSIDLIYAHHALTDSQALNEASFSRNSNQTNYSSTSLCQPKSTYEASQSHHTVYPIRRLPDVKSFSPQQGTSGSLIHIHLRADYDLFAPPGLILSLTFASKRVAADLTRLESTGSSFEYLVLSSAPQYSETGSSAPRVQLRLQLQEESGQDAGVVDIGHFEYMVGQLQFGPPNVTRKRKMSDEDPLSSSLHNYSSYPFASSVSSAYPTSLHSVDLDSMSRRFTPYGRSQITQAYRDPSCMPTTLPSKSLMRLPTSQASDWSPSLKPLHDQCVMDSDTQSLSLSSSSHSNPILVRTTTLQQSGSSGSAPAAVSSKGFNPYMYPQKAILKIHGDLDSMTEDWTPAELDAKRRLVQFSRSQTKSTINATFTPVAPEDRQPNSICISCIWWEERQECFATSVDTIQLLEQLVALRFTVEEKNRIRRNLEGFHPETVSKGKADSEEFFKIIMGFPHPKPRNIEKDVKVFPWKILGHALKKIISKYVSRAVMLLGLVANIAQSASYSSTAGAVPTTRSSIYYQSDSADYGRLGFRSAYDSTAPSACAPTLGSQMPPYTENPPSGTLPSISSHYSASNQYTHEHPDIPRYPTPTHHQRSDSATGHESPRQYKRPRANTSLATLYSHEEAALSLGQMSRRYSEQPNKMRLPSFAESHAQTSSEPIYNTQEQVTPGMTQSRVGNCGPYDFNTYINANVADKGQVEEQKEQEAVDSGAQQSG
ncbi:MAG: hypothetical protein Q9217_002500 [Psora testacea]